MIQLPRRPQFHKARKSYSKLLKSYRQTTPDTALGLFCPGHAQKASFYRVRWLAANHSELPNETMHCLESSQQDRINGIEGFWLIPAAKFILFQQNRI